MLIECGVVAHVYDAVAIPLVPTTLPT